MDAVRNGDEDGEPQSIGSELRPGRPWSWSTADAAADTPPSMHDSLFSPSIPPVLSAPDVAPGVSTRQQPSLGSVASMTIRNARLKMFDASPIVQRQRQMPEAQKIHDDPSKAVEMKHDTMTSLSSLFTNSRAPSYSNGTGPLYLRCIFLTTPA